jgi:hypothetical protein
MSETECAKRRRPLPLLLCVPKDPAGRAIQQRTASELRTICVGAYGSWIYSLKRRGLGQLTGALASIQISHPALQEPIE